MIRVAKLMADYWKATGTRPSATIKFMPTDGEEDGSLGSRGLRHQHDRPRTRSTRSAPTGTPTRAPAATPPAATATRPTSSRSTSRSASPTSRASRSSTRRCPRSSRTSSTASTTRSTPTRTSSRRSSRPPRTRSPTDVGKYLFVQTDHPLLFSSDWTNFIAARHPVLQPDARRSPVRATRRTASRTCSRCRTRTRTASSASTRRWTTSRRCRASRVRTRRGNSYPEAYMKGMEFCSHLLAWGMLQHNAGGAQTADTDPVAYYEALPNEATKGELVDVRRRRARYQYADVASRKLVADAQLQYKWDFGDGSATAFGKTRQARLQARRSVYPSKLTVTNRAVRQVGHDDGPDHGRGGSAPPTQNDPPGQDVDTLPAERLHRRPASRRPASPRSRSSPRARA